MEQAIYKAEERGHFDHGWLDTHHSFSFANYYNPDRMNFGALRVLNDDIVKPGTGFGRHPHDNMEIISIPLSGAILHRDSMGHEQTIKPNEVQVMSAGTGLFHEEYNASKKESVNFLQIWIIPDKTNTNPIYDQKYFEPEKALNNWQLLVSPENENTLKIQQDAYISRIIMDSNQSTTYKLNNHSNGVYFFVIEGEPTINNSRLQQRDAMGINKKDRVDITSTKSSKILAIEIPIN